MALAIYKPGQGYWTRLMSAIGAATLVLTGVAWAWNEMDNVGTNASLIFNYADLGTAVKAWARASNPQQPEADLALPVGAVKTSPAGDNAPPQLTLIDAAGKNWKLSADQIAAALPALQIAAKMDPVRHFTADDITGLSITQSGSTGNSVSFTTATFAAHNRIYFQAGVAVVIILGFGAVLFWVFNKPRIVEFMIATEAEMNKVAWPSRRQLVVLTWVVIVGTFLMAMILFGVDVVFAFMFKQIHILQS